ncbi:hypothetical protein F4810DRAFT_220574 [Camillea tinctor]|nr:hypothetical protein F4810DRAFT_220574 [Camillea tinctor]
MIPMIEPAIEVSQRKRERENSQLKGYLSSPFSLSLSFLLLLLRVNTFPSVIHTLPPLSLLLLPFNFLLTLIPINTNPKHITHHILKLTTTALSVSMFMFMLSMPLTHTLSLLTPLISLLRLLLRAYNNTPIFLLLLLHLLLFFLLLKQCLFVIPPFPFAYSFYSYCCSCWWYCCYRSHRGTATPQRSLRRPRPVSEPSAAVGEVLCLGLRNSAGGDSEGPVAASPGAADLLVDGCWVHRGAISDSNASIVCSLRSSRGLLFVLGDI